MNDDQLLQEVGELMYRYYQGRGRGLEKFARMVIAKVVTANTEDILASSNVYRLSSASLYGLDWDRNDCLLVGENQQLKIFTCCETPQGAGSGQPVPLKECKWNKEGDFFANGSTIEELLNRSATVYLLRKQ